MLIPVYIYARLSRVEKKKRTVESVESQIAESSAWAVEHGREVLAVFKDNLTASRFSLKDRPDFVRMMNGIHGGGAAEVLVTEQSRLDRQLWNILELIELARSTPFKRIVKVRDDEILDLSTESGINRVIDQANRDRHESELISQRVRARKREHAQAGRFNGGRRPYGYERDGITVRESEARIIQEIVERILAGASRMSIIRWLNAEHIPASGGGRWHLGPLNDMLRSKRLIGVRVHNGAEYPAEWPAIISREQWDKLQLILDARAARGKRFRVSRAYLLTGFVVCGGCGNHMIGAGHTRNGSDLERRYFCRAQDSTGQALGCGKVARVADPLELIVSEAVLRRLESRDVAGAFGAATSDSDVQAALSDYQDTKSNLASLLHDYYLERNKYAKDAMLQLKAELEARLEQITRKMERLDSTRALAAITPAQQIRSTWNNADLSLKQSLIGLLIEKIVVLPGRSGAKRWRDEESGRSWYFDPSKIQIVWRV